MRKPSRWIRSAIEGAAACRTRLPWERGLRRAATIARRVSAPPPLRAVPFRRAS
jgi:hypothetical protein